MVYERLARQLARACESTVEEILGPAEESDLEALTQLGVPDSVADFYRDFAPLDTIELNDIRLWPLAHLIDENQNYSPGAEVHELGYVVIAGNRQGDIYCLDLGADGTEDPPAVVLLPHAVQIGARDRDLVEKQAQPAADSFDDFLLMWARGEIGH